MDFITDRSQAIVNFVTQLLDLEPDVSKVASLGVDGLHKSSFGDPVAREFPLHTYEAVVFSTVASRISAPGNEKLAARLKAAASRLGHPGLYDELVEAADSRLKEASSEVESYFALTLENDLGDKQASVLQFYPINDEIEISESSRAVVTDHTSGRLPLEMAVDASREIVKRANTLDCVRDVIPEVLKWGRPRMVDTEKAAKFLKRRTTITRDEDYTKLANALCEDLDESQSPHQHMVIGSQAAEAAARLDQLHGIDPEKSAYTVLDPYSAIFSGPSVEAVEEDAQDVVLIGNVPTPAYVVSGLNVEKVAQVFEPEVAEKILAIRKLVGEGKTAHASLQISELNDYDRNDLSRLLVQA